AIGAPGRFTHVTVAQHEPLTYPPVGRYGVQDAARAFGGCVEEHAGVGCPAWGVVQVARRNKDLLTARGTIHDCNTIHVSVALHHGQLLAVEVHAHVGVV